MMKKREYLAPSLQWREIEAQAPLAMSGIEVGGEPTDRFDVRGEACTMEEANETFWQ